MHLIPNPEPGRTDSRDRVDRLAGAGVVLAHGQQAAAVMIWGLSLDLNLMGAQTAATVLTASPAPVWSSRTASRRPRGSSTAASAKRCPSTRVSCSGAPTVSPRLCLYSCWSCRSPDTLQPPSLLPLHGMC